MATTPTETKRKGLPPEAYEVIPGDQYPPYVSADQTMPEFTLKAVLIGILLGWSSARPTHTWGSAWDSRSARPSPPQ